MIKNKKLLIALVIFTVWLYGAWTFCELVVTPLINGFTDNGYIRVLLRDGLMKSIVWTLPAIFVIKRFSDDMLVGFRELFTFKKPALKYLLIALPVAAFVIAGVLMRTHTLAVSESFHPSSLLIVLFVGFTEEIVFRGLYLNATLKHAATDMKKYLSVGVNALMFLAIHFPIWISEGVFVTSFTGFGFVSVLLLSVLFSYCLMKCRNIWVAAIIHSFYDLLVFVFV